MCEIETGVQVLQRISSGLSPFVGCLEPVLFPDGGPSKGELVEITGETNSGKSCLILELIAKIILPKNCGGQAVGAVFINCDNNINMARLLNIMEKHIVNCSTPANQNTDRREIQRIREESFSRLTIITCYTLDEFELSMLTLSDLFVKNPHNVFLLIDSIVAFYWSRCTEKNLIRMDTYLKLLHNKLKKMCRENKVVIIYTKPSYFGAGRKQKAGESDAAEQSSLGGLYPSSSGCGSGSGGINLPVEHRLELTEAVGQTPSNDTKFTALVNSKNKQFTRYFLIDRYGINWLNERV
ncbi:uncharacterized protein LOC129769417 [Toxorhynchites rutilus septentrionalis]|uniref:uncharacterized protein LOC129766633 n=1 Tax=Toxorhynchites rutilus septentrionalis TaxID=329112 RepID=UPI002479D7AC|nr:uncharacterized protein LOC129766633 [Toxorhynchites rutilus septentrionalis]XP_055627668.1 uncharacterized protein LOC129769417 [Toxorhynchites rutilus septentrionalis]